MSTKIVLATPPGRPVPALPAALAVAPVYGTNHKFDTRPSFQTRAELISRVAKGEVFDVSGVPSLKTGTVIAVLNSFGIITANVEVVEGIITQVL